MLVKEALHSKVSKEKEELLDEKRRESLKDIEEELPGKVMECSFLHSVSLLPYCSS